MDEEMGPHDPWFKFNLASSLPSQASLALSNALYERRAYSRERTVHGCCQMADPCYAQQSNHADKQAVLNQVLTQLIALQFLESYTEPCKRIVHPASPYP